MPDPKETLHRYLRSSRGAMLWKLEGLSEYDVRRPMTPTGTNLLGLVKHLAMVEIDYFGETFGRPFPGPVPAFDPDVDETADLWATAEESRDYLVDHYRSACAHADATIGALDLDGVGRVPHWPDDRAEVTLHQILVHVLSETSRHAGHADIVREHIDGTVGLQEGNDNMIPGDTAAWQRHRDHLEQVAGAFRWDYRPRSGGVEESESGL